MADAAIWLLSGAGALAAAQLLSRLINQRRRNTSLGQLPPTNPAPVNAELDDESLWRSLSDLDGMARKLEGLKRMQLEIQRSIRQECSAVLNGSGAAAETSEHATRFAPVREGRCSICNIRDIDSALYRCGHMCTCFECAIILVQGEAKCPMCQAPVVDMFTVYGVAK